MDTPRKQNPSQSREEQINRLSEDELAGMANRYGSDRRPGSTWLLYHNETHAREVASAAQSLARELASRRLIDDRFVAVAAFAGAGHDHEQLKGSGPNERESADAITQVMRAHPELFSPAEIEAADRAIMGTVVSMSPSGLVQAAPKDDLIAACVADADLSGLAARNGIVRAFRLLVETESLAGRIPVPRNASEVARLEIESATVERFLGFQERLVGNHEFLLDISRIRYAGGLRRNQDANHALLERCRAGEPFSELYATAVELAGPTELAR
jgi:hypothetical protein